MSIFQEKAKHTESAWSLWEGDAVYKQINLRLLFTNPKDE